MSYASTILATSGLVAFWELGDSSGSSTAIDSGPNGVTASVIGTVTFGVTGQGGQTAAAFTGSTNGHLSVPNNGAINALPAFTIEGWVNAAGPNDGVGIFTELFASNTLRMALGFDSNPVHDASNDLPFCGFYNGGASGWQSAFSASTLVQNSWQYFVGTFDGTSLNIYTNATLSGTLASAVGYPSSNHTGFVIGSRHDNSVNFDGSMQYIALYNRALTPTEITAHFNAMTSATANAAITEVSDRVSITSGPVASGSSVNLENSDLVAAVASPLTTYKTDFTFSPLAGPASLSVAFTDTSTVTPSGSDTKLGWTWNFGDGTTSTLQNPSHVYQNQGNYAPRLTVTWASEGSVGPTSHSVVVLPRQAPSPVPPAPPIPITVSQYISLIIPEHRNGAILPPPSPPIAIGTCRIQESNDIGVISSISAFISGAINEGSDSVFALANPFIQVFETTMSSPTWPTNIYGSNPQDCPIVLSVAPDIALINRNFQPSSVPNAAGDGNVYHYDPSTGAFLGTTLQSAASTPFKNWALFNNGIGATRNVIMSTTDGNNVYGLPNEFLSSSTNFISSSSASWPGGATIFDFGNLLFATSGFSGSYQIVSIFPCADFQHVIAILNDSGVYKWAILNCVHGSEAVTQSGTILDTASQQIAGLGFLGVSDSIGTNMPTGFGNATRPMGCLQSDLKYLWTVFYNDDGDHLHGRAQIVVSYVNPSTFDMQIIAGQIGTYPSQNGTPAFPATNASQANQNLAAAIWADNFKCAIVAGQGLTMWTL